MPQNDVIEILSDDESDNDSLDNGRHWKELKSESNANTGNNFPARLGTSGGSRMLEPLPAERPRYNDGSGGPKVSPKDVIEIPSDDGSENDSLNDGQSYRAFESRSVLGAGNNVATALGTDSGGLALRPLPIGWAHCDNGSTSNHEKQKPIRPGISRGRHCDDDDRGGYRPDQYSEPEHDKDDPFRRPRRKRRRRTRYTSEDDAKIRQMKKQGLSWLAITKHLPGRTVGAIEVRYRSKLKTADLSRNGARQLCDCSRALSPVSDDADEEEDWEVDEICGHRRLDNRSVELLVKWKGGEKIWEPSKNVSETEALDRYERLHGQAPVRNEFSFNNGFCFGGRLSCYDGRNFLGRGFSGGGFLDDDDFSWGFLIGKGFLGSRDLLDGGGSSCDSGFHFSSNSFPQCGGFCFRRRV
ncbi:hypothetical protein VTI74DRAFT_9290 [Chaetomium olivicolor]